MDESAKPEEAEKALERVEKEEGLTRENQMESFRLLADLGHKYLDVQKTQEETKQHLIAAELKDNQSRRDYKLAIRQLDMLEKVLTAHFAERKTQIEGGFRMIDKALEEGNWDAATKVFGDMSTMVAKSPLAAATALNDKVKSGKAITLNDFD
jgi:hypothetical protein